MAVWKAKYSETTNSVSILFKLGIRSLGTVLTRKSSVRRFLGCECPGALCPVGVGQC